MAHHEGGPGEGPCCGPSSGGGHLEDTAGMWEQAFQRALREVHVEVLKERIRKAWGRQIEAVADEVVKAMTEEWTAFMRREAARDALRETVRRGFAKGPQ